MGDGEDLILYQKAEVERCWVGSSCKDIFGARVFVAVVVDKTRKEEKTRENGQRDGPVKEIFECLHFGGMTRMPDR